MANRSPGRSPDRSPDRSSSSASSATDTTLLPYLTDETLALVLHELDIARGDLRFRADRRVADLPLQEEWAAVNRAWLTAKAERTARLALDTNVRRFLAESAPATTSAEAVRQFMARSESERAAILAAAVATPEVSP